MNKRLLLIIVGLGCLSLSISQGYAKRSRQESTANHQINFPLIWRMTPQDWIGPDGGLITSVAIDSKNPANVYAGSYGGGVYKSTDGGATWMRASTGLGNQVIVSLAVDPANPAVLYAGTYRGGVYKSTNSGAIWNYASEGIQDEAIVYSIVIDPQATLRVFIATRGYSNNNSQPWAGVVYRSEDGGATWTPSLSNLGGANYQDWVYALEINPNAPNIIFGATHEHGPIRSEDYGATWEVLTNGITNYSTRAIVVDPRPNHSDTVYTGVWTKDGVFKSTNGGEYWELKSDGITGANIYGMAINPFAPNTLFAATYNMGVRKTTNGANTWSGVGLGEVGVPTVRVSPGGGQPVFAGTAGDGLYVSQDGGQDWNHSQTHLTASSVTSLVVSPGDPASYFVSLDGAGVMRSQDSGLTWTEFNNNLSDRIIHALVKHPAENTLFALTEDSGLYRCNLDDGCSWQETGLNNLATSLPGPAVSGEGRFDGSRETFLSLYDDAATTDGVLAPGGSAALLAMAFAPSDPNIVYIGTGGAGVYKSTNGGNSWASTGLKDQKVWGIAIHPNNPNILYAATDQAGAIKASLDGGASWQDVDLPGLTVYTLVIPPAQANILLAGTSDGVYQLSGGVGTQIGLAGQTVTAFGNPPDQPALFFAGTTNGVWISPDSGGDWYPGPGNLEGITVQSFSFSPFNPDLVFYNTLAHGTLRAGIDY
jgi:photosystem II stability/assembly factor-like uncharacterized protein